MTDQPATRLNRVSGAHPWTREAAPTQGLLGDLTPELESTDEWSDAMLARAGLPVIDSPFVSIGGGIGSFVLADYLRIAGVPTESIRVLSDLDYPWQTY